jgi:predicted component of type VI protein secretion system
VQFAQNEDVTMDVKLVVVSGKHAGQAVTVAGPQFRVGRGPDCQLRPSSREIATHHCAILVEEGRAMVRDLNSATGTFVNDKRLAAPQELRNGDRIRVGQLEFEVQLTVSLGGKKKPKIRSIQEAAARTVASAARDEADVAGWLSEPETEKPQQDEPAEAEEPDAVQQKYINMFGNQPDAKPASASSRDAAADLLRQMFDKKK